MPKITDQDAGKGLWYDPKHSENIVEICVLKVFCKNRFSFHFKCIFVSNSFGEKTNIFAQLFKIVLQSKIITLLFLLYLDLYHLNGSRSGFRPFLGTDPEMYLDSGKWFGSYGAGSRSGSGSTTLHNRIREKRDGNQILFLSGTWVLWRMIHQSRWWFVHLTSGFTPSRMRTQSLLMERLTLAPIPSRSSS